MIKNIVENLMKKHSTNCPFTLAKRLNVTIKYENLGNTMGYFTKDFRIKFIHINQQLAEGECIFTCAHELGHAILHPDINTPFLKRHTLFSTDRIEREANTFAVEFLLSDKILREYENCALTSIAMNYGIPEKLVCLKEMESKFF